MNNINLSRKRFSKIPLSQKCKSIILGSILGDGSLKIYPGYKNARFFIKHSIIQQEYFYWKTIKLQEISSKKSIQILKPTGFSKNNKLNYCSRALNNLTSIYNLTYNSNKLSIKRFWLNHLDELSLLIWWLDDGSLISNNRKGVLCTDNFNYKELKILRRYLLVVWNIKVKINPVTKVYKGKNKVYYRLWLNTNELKKFLNIILPFVESKSMLYKFKVLYKDRNLQQRWITQFKEKLPNFTNEIDILYSKNQIE